MSTFVEDLTSTSTRRIEQAGVQHIDEVRAEAAPLIAYSDALQQDNLVLKRFLRETLYHHHQVYRVMTKAKRVVRDLFAALMADPRLMPPEFAVEAQAQEAQDGVDGRARVVSDYVSGMTDRFALDEHERLFDPRRLR
jgi:dGTPase